ncbi:Aim4p [Lachancea thermotolerans CBS 6340]|uniref:Altered inheritance of mitochondria protein 4 n=1 Tax=Lachancea thermotolerans (strain ATCC 56472 / CBS 6340 / NRRL Y-8284) TaxID=559295 RepID=AIM4_LACTC|nr:KLTH0E12738p [Lachancea thermotolerans CBS 6340]C5DII3.1 RecName: Full=Altered inheritance of mitochondria protein 4 [Lachancea thermotolerans CBS 6340]CAR23594.1 KLTH0E12738p [Lachancea thermotolerans CBS 6340]
MSKSNYMSYSDEKSSSKSFGFENNNVKNQELGERSIFYDHEWNPEGKAPSGYKNVPYNQYTFKRKSKVEPKLQGFKSIPFPSSEDKQP